MLDMLQLNGCRLTAWPGRTAYTHTHIHTFICLYRQTCVYIGNVLVAVCNGAYERFVYIRILSALWLMPLMVSTLTNPTKQQLATNLCKFTFGPGAGATPVTGKYFKPSEPSELCCNQSLRYWQKLIKITNPQIIFIFSSLTLPNGKIMQA